MKKGRLFVISGPSAVGKGTIVARLTSESENISLSVSATTRDPREGEKEGVSYYFLSDQEFLSRVDAGGFLEHASVHGHYYGTPKAPVVEKLAAGKDVILEIDVQGAMQVKESYPEAVFVFILPPTMEELRHRFALRGTESQDVIELRMSKAAGEIEYLSRYDYYVINDDLETAIDDVRAIMDAEHHRVDVYSEELLSRYKEVNA